MMLIFGSSEMILVHSGVLRVMKNKFLRSELIMDTILGHNSDLWVNIMLDLLEEASRFLLKIAETVMVIFIENMMLSRIEVIGN